MEGKIKEGGTLEIKRGNEFRKQICLYDQEGSRCGGWCPQFGEPVEQNYSESGSICKGDKRIDIKRGDKTGKTILKICQNRELFFDKFTDERELITCTACNGSGYYGNNNSPKCEACDGTGKELLKPE